MVTLAETTGAGVWDVNNALNFPNKHPLCLSMDKPSLKKTDLDARPRCAGLGKAAHRAQQHHARSSRSLVAAELRLRRDRLRRDRHQQVGDGLLPHAAVLGARARRHHRSAMPELTRICRRAHRQGSEASRRRSRTARSRSASATTRSGRKWQKDARKDWDASPITFAAPRAWKSGTRSRTRTGCSPPTTSSTTVAQALGLRQALPPSGRRARHLDPDRHLARRGARPQGEGPARGRHPARRRPDVRRRRALGRGQVRDPDAGRDAQQPRLLQRLGAPDPHGASCAAPTRPRRISAWTCSDRSRTSARSRARWAATAKARSTSPKDVGPALERAIAEVKKGRLALVDTITQHKGGSTTGD